MMKEHIKYFFRSGQVIVFRGIKKLYGFRFKQETTEEIFEEPSKSKGNTNGFELTQYHYHGHYE